MAISAYNITFFNFFNKFLKTYLSSKSTYTKHLIPFILVVEIKYPWIFNPAHGTALFALEVR